MEWTEKEINEVKNLILNGKNYKEISIIINRSRDSIRYVTNKYDIKYKKFNPSISCSDNEKYCGTCGQIKSKSEFNKNKKNKDNLNSICRECSNKRSKQYYSENIEHHKKVVQEHKKKIVYRNKKFIIDYLKNNPCIDCGETNIITLEFDHRDNVKKEFIISDAISKGFKIERIKKEINKCDVRCANCHRIRTSKQFNWYSDFEL